MTDDIAGLIARLRDMMYRVSRNDAEKLGEISDALSRLSQQVQQQALEYTSLFDQCSEALRKVAELEIMLSGERGLKEIWQQRANEWCAKVAELESQLAARERAEPVAWETTEKAVCIALTKSAFIAQQWRDNGYPVIEYFARPPAAASSAYALNYAKGLAAHLWKTHFSEKSPDWKCPDDMLGVLMQIDEMVAGMRRPVEASEWVSLIERLRQAEMWTYVLPSKDHQYWESSAAPFEAADAITSLSQRVAELNNQISITYLAIGNREYERDATRYRWLRRQAIAIKLYASGNPNWEIDYVLRGESFEAAIDAAIAAQAGSKGAS